MSKMQSKVYKNNKICTLCLVFLLIFASLIGLSACGPVESEEELLAQAKELCEKSKAVNELCFGAGILTEEEGYKLGAYRAASKASLEQYGVNSIAEIEARVGEVYSLTVTSWIKNTVFTSGKSDSGVLNYARYYDSTEDAYQGLMVKEDYEPTVKGVCTYSDYVLTEQSRNSVTFTVTVTVTYEGRSITIPSTKLTMCKEEGVWRLDTPSYATYYEQK